MKLVVPFTPGTGIDLIARQVGPALAQRLGRPVFVDNKPGASGNLGTLEVVRAAPDGSTLLVTVNTLVMNRALFPHAGFDPLRDLDPVTLTSWGQLVLVASNRSGIDSAHALVARARAKPGALNYGSPGAGTPHHLAMELLKQQTHTSLTHIPYRGTAPAVTDLLGGTVDAMFLPIHVVLQHCQGRQPQGAGDQLGQARTRCCPAYRRCTRSTWATSKWRCGTASSRPGARPGPLVDRLNAELGVVLAQPEVRSAFETQGMVPAHSTPEQFRALMASDAARWAQLIAMQGIKAA